MAYTLEGTTGTWEIVVGLEVHAQVISQAKLFSGAATAFGAAPNSQVSFVDAAFPGMLPVINTECVAQAVRTGLGLNAHIHIVSRFDRKNYFYADLPSGYQISQFEHPIVGTGEIEVELADGSTKTIGITRLHLEQDAGKSIHDQHPTKTLIDLNPTFAARRRPAPTSVNSAPSCAIWALATAIWKKGPCAPMSTYPSASMANPTAPAARSRM
jgi:aspartyl-tRNA(Asn)/glutamyl-tRNA(Gln) amidotransferase subunit B